MLDDNGGGRGYDPKEVRETSFTSTVKDCEKEINRIVEGIYKEFSDLAQAARENKSLEVNDLMKVLSKIKYMKEEISRVKVLMP